MTKYNSKKTKRAITRKILLLSVACPAGALPVSRVWAASTTIADVSGAQVSLGGTDSLLVSESGILSTGTKKAVQISDPTGVTVHVDAGASILSQDDGIHAQAVANGTPTVTITNAGTIRSTGGGYSINLDSISASNAITRIVNAGSLISDDSDGVRPGAGATVTNSGLIHADGEVGDKHDGVDFQSYSGTVVNETGGTISGERHGITSDTDVDVTNAANATIIGRNGSGVGSDGTGTVVNHGTIIGGYDGSGTGDGDGVDIDDHFVIDNYGTIEAQGAAGAGSDGTPNVSEAVTATGGGTLINESGATITSVQVGVTLGGAGSAITFTNHGTVYGADIGVRFPDSTVLFNDGQILSDNIALEIGSNGDAVQEIQNYGAVEGGVYALFIYPGAQAVLGLHAGATLSGVIADLGALTLDSDVSDTVSDIIQGTGLLTKTGKGNVTLTGLNTYSGGTTISGGTLTGTTASFGSGAIVDDATLAIAQDGDGTLANAISGSGTLTKGGAGNVTLTGSNTYVGGTHLAAGILTGATSAFGSGAIADDAALVVAQNTDGTLANAISGTGTLAKLGSGNVTLAGANTYAGGTTIGAGALTGTTSSFGTGTIADNAALALLQDGDGTLANAITGTGTLTKGGAGDITITADSPFAGATTIVGGTLTVAGAIADSSITVASGGTLSGTGTVGTTTVAAGGTLDTACNGVGTGLHVAGDLSLLAGSTYLVALDGSGAASQSAVGGAVVLGGGTLGVDIVGHPLLSPGTSYSLIDAAGGVSGRFGAIAGAIATDYDFLAPVLSYGADSVTLTMQRNGLSFAAAGGTRNQRQAGTGLDGATQTALLTVFENLSRADARPALDAVSGEIHASARTALIQDAFHVRNAVLDRVRGGCVAPGGCAGRGISLWGAAYGSWGHNRSDGDAAGLHHSLGGFVLGGDSALSDSTRVGVLAGYGHAAFDAGAVASGGHSNDVTLGAYAAQRWGRVLLNYGGLYSWNMLSTNRAAVLPGYADHLSSDYLAGTAQAFADLAYLAYRGHAVQFAPFADLAYVNLHADAFHEHGGAAALEGRAMDIGDVYSTFGLRGSSALHLGRVAFTADASLGWQHIYGVVRPTVHESLAAGSGDFEVAGVPLARDAAALGAGINAGLARNLSVQLSYVGQYGSGVVDNGMRGKVSMKF